MRKSLPGIIGGKVCVGFGVVSTIVYMKVATGTYDDCILQYERPGMTREAAYVVESACADKYDHTTLSLPLFSVSLNRDHYAALAC